MHGFIQRFRNKINGVISGFDRIVFKGCLRPIAYADGAMAFLRWHGVLAALPLQLVNLAA